MDLSEAYADFIDNGGFDEDDYPIDKFIRIANRVMPNDWAYIVSAIKSNYNWDVWKVQDGDIIVWQTEYKRPEAMSDTQWNLKINQVSVCYTGDTYDDGELQYVPARMVNPNKITKHWSYYVNNQPESDPIYFTADKSVFIAPSFSEVIEQWIELRGIKSLTEWEEDMTESEMWIPFYLQDMVIQWCIAKAKEADTRFDEAEYFDNKHKELREQAWINLSTVSTWPTSMMYPEWDLNRESNNDIIID